MLDIRGESGNLFPVCPEMMKARCANTEPSDQESFAKPVLRTRSWNDLIRA